MSRRAAATSQKTFSENTKNELQQLSIRMKLAHEAIEKPNPITVVNFSRAANVFTHAIKTDTSNRIQNRSERAKRFNFAATLCYAIAVLGIVACVAAAPFTAGASLVGIPAAIIVVNFANGLVIGQGIEAYAMRKDVARDNAILKNAVNIEGKINEVAAIPAKVAYAMQEVANAQRNMTNPSVRDTSNNRRP